MALKAAMFWTLQWATALTAGTISQGSARGTGTIHPLEAAFLWAYSSLAFGKQLFAEACRNFSFALQKMLSKYLRNRALLMVRVNTEEYQLYGTQVFKKAERKHQWKATACPGQAS